MENNFIDFKDENIEIIDRINMRTDFNHIGKAFIFSTIIVYVINYLFYLCINSWSILQTVQLNLPIEDSINIYNEFLSSELGVVIIRIFSIIISLTSLTIPFIICRKRTNTDKMPIFNGFNLSFGFMLIAVTVSFGLNILGGYLAAAMEQLLSIFGFIPISPDFSYSETSSLYNIFISVSIMIIAPIFEEFVFRGVILNILKQYGDGFAIVVSSLIFGLFHENLIQFFSAFLGGVIFAYIAIKANSIIPTIFIHFFNNTYITITGILSENNDIIFNITIILEVTAFVFSIMFLIIRFAFNNTNQESETTAVYKKERMKLFFSSPPVIISMAVLVLFIIRSITFV